MTTPQKSRDSLSSALSAATMVTNSEHKRKSKRATAAMVNGEVHIKGTDRVQGSAKSHHQRINQTISKIEIHAQKIPELDERMQAHLIEAKERGNLSFSTSDN